MKEIIEASFLRENFEKFTRQARLSRGGARFIHEAYAWKELATLLNCLPESDYDKGMRKAMSKIAKLCGKTFTVDIGYETLPNLIDELVNDKNQIDKEIAAMEKQPELTKENSPQGVVSSISNRLHNIGCEHQDSELGEELGGMACDIWKVLPMISNKEPQEKQPEYEYTKITTVFDLDRDEMRSGIYGDLQDGKFYPMLNETETVLLLKKGRLLRRVEITPEQKREREVEELAKAMFDADYEGGITTGDDGYVAFAKLAIEWMESKK